MTAIARAALGLACAVIVAALGGVGLLACGAAVPEQVERSTSDEVCAQVDRLDAAIMGPDEAAVERQLDRLLAMRTDDPALAILLADLRLAVSASNERRAAQVTFDLYGACY